MVKPVKDVAASIRQRLLNLARDQGQPFDVILVRYGLERLLYRLSISKYRSRFILKGGLLVTLWIEDAMRVTRDVDLLGSGENDADHLMAVFREILSVDTDDGLLFDTNHLTAGAIREEIEYGGTRLRTTAVLAGAKIPITVDIAFGDVVTPAADDVDFTSLLDHDRPNVRAYPPETVIAEKFQAMIALGMINGRMKDYYDLWAIPRSRPISQEALANAIRSTLARRNTAIPQEVPPGLSPAFYTSSEKLRQWKAYAASINLVGVSLEEVVTRIWQVLGPACVLACQ